MVLQLAGHLVIHYQVLPILCLASIYVQGFNDLLFRKKMGSTSPILPVYGKEMPAKKAWDIKIHGYYRTDTNNWS